MNPVAQLNEWTQANKKSPPKYVYTHKEDGSFSCCVTAADIECFGTGPNKKAAKNDAAIAMGKKINLHGIEARQIPISPLRSGAGSSELAPTLPPGLCHAPFPTKLAPPKKEETYYLIDVENRPGDLKRLLDLAANRDRTVVVVYLSNKLPARQKVIEACAGAPNVMLRETRSGYPDAADILMISDAAMLLETDASLNYRVVLVSGDTIFYTFADVYRDKKQLVHVSSLL